LAREAARGLGRPAALWQLPRRRLSREKCGRKREISFGMTSRARSLRGLTGGVLAPLLALVLALRVIAAPLIMAAPEPGLIAICSGGKIYYVSIDGAPGNGEAPPSKPCPFVGNTLALADPAPVPVVPRRGVLDLVRPLPGAVTLPAAAVAANPARAPPLSV